MVNQRVSRWIPMESLMIAKISKITPVCQLKAHAAKISAYLI
jgi:hypothetical protein